MIIFETLLLPEEKLCPYCGKVIKKNAKRCKHCKRYLIDKEIEYEEGKSSLIKRIFNNIKRILNKIIDINN